MDEIEIRQQSALAHKNFFEEYGEQSSRNIVGQLLKFNKGDYYAGQDSREIPRGKKLVAQMATLTRGWIRWADNKPDQQILGLVAEGFRPPRREDLGDMDRALWELDREGRPLDPWQNAVYLLMKEPGEPADPENNVYTLTGGSKGMQDAIQSLSREYGKHIREFPDEDPIVTLDFEAYKHESWGVIKKPKFPIVGWEKSKD